MEPARQRAVVQSQCSWWDKSPLIYSQSEEESAFVFNGEHLTVQQVGEGNFHRVFTFINESTLQLGEEVLPLKNLVLKILNSGEVGPNKQKKIIESEKAAYLRLSRAAIPIPRVYIWPDSFQDKENPKNGKFWIVEKMAPINGESWRGLKPFTSLSQTDQKILNWAKSWLDKMANTCEDLINDFRLRNTMLNTKGEPVIVDFSCPEEDEWEREHGLCHYAIDWANGNFEVFKYLIKDFPKDIKQQALNSWENKGT